MGKVGFAVRIAGFLAGCRVMTLVGFGVVLGVSGPTRDFKSKMSWMIISKLALLLSSIRTSSSEHPYTWHPREKILLKELKNELLSSEFTIPSSTNCFSRSSKFHPLFIGVLNTSYL